MARRFSYRRDAATLVSLWAKEARENAWRARWYAAAGFPAEDSARCRKEARDCLLEARRCKELVRLFRDYPRIRVRTATRMAMEYMVERAGGHRRPRALPRRAGGAL